MSNKFTQKIPNSRGVIYCATTKIAYLEAALISAIALRSQEPDLPITIVSDLDILNQLPLNQYQISPIFLDISEIDGTAFSSRYVKTNLNSFSPYYESIFLDSIQKKIVLRVRYDIWMFFL